jgi:HEAT repeat protein
LGVLAIGIIAISAALLFRPSLPPQPYYQGRSLDSWLDEWSTNQIVSNPTSNPTDYTKIVAAIGTNAIPFVFRRLERDDSFLKNKYREVWPKLPGVVKKFLPNRRPNWPYGFFSSAMAARAFESCGTNAIPLLVPRLKDGNPAVREACIESLFLLVRDSMSKNELISMFLPCLDDSDPLVLVNAANIFRHFGPAGSNAIPALIRNLQSNEAGRHKFMGETVFVRANSASALGRMGSIAVSAVPALTNLMTSTDPYARASAATALWEITSNANFSLPVLIREFPTYDRYGKPTLIQTFGEMGPLAKGALPILINELTNTDSRTLETLTNALKRIDSDAAEKAGIK